MADINKQYLDYAGLQEVVTQIKTLISSNSEFSGAAADVTVADVAGLLAAENVEAALAEILGITGKLTDLQTTNKATLVAAINEIKAAIGGNVNYSGKADKVASATAGNFAGLDAQGNLTDSGKKAADFDVAGAAAAVSGYAKGETAKTVKEVAESLGTAAAANVATVAIEAEGEVTTALPTVGQVETYVTSKVAGLTGAVRFRGIVTALSEVTDPKSGDMAIVGAKEYIYNGTGWQELGDEGAYVIKEAGKSLVSNADITKLESITVAETDKVASVTDGANTLKISSIPLTGEGSIAKLFG